MGDAAMISVSSAFPSLLIECYSVLSLQLQVAYSILFFLGVPPPQSSSSTMTVQGL
jgi:hypothetical protein